MPSKLRHLWVVGGETGPGLVRLTDPGETTLYDGELVLPGAWIQLATTAGGCVLFVGTGLHLQEGLGSVAEGLARLTAAARDGRLVGAVVAVTTPPVTM